MTGDTERGAVAVLVAVMMVALIGFAALGIDVAQMSSHKQQLQNGADAGALAVAQSCATGNCGSYSAYNAVADALAKSNRADGQASGSVLTPSLSPATGQVTVKTTGVSDHWLASVIGVDETEVNAQATAVWGTVRNGTSVLPIAISLCEIEQLVKAGDGTFVPGGPAGYTIANPTGKVIEIILVQPSDKPKDDEIKALCPVTYVPGGFSWITSDSNKKLCTAWTEIGQWVGNNTGNDIPAECTYTYLASLIGKKVAIPVFDIWQKDKTEAYHIAGYAGFVLTGFNLDKNKIMWGSASDYSKNCTGTGKSRCIKGYFTETVDLSADLDPSGPDLGSNTVRLSK